MLRGIDVSSHDGWSNGMVGKSNTATAYPLVANVWELGYGEQVSQTCSILALCVGVLKATN